MAKKMKIVPEQESIEVFANDSGSVSICQTSFAGRGEDSLIYIHTNYIPALIKALRKAAKEAEAIDAETGQ